MRATAAILLFVACYAEIRCNPSKDDSHTFKIHTQGGLTRVTGHKSNEIEDNVSFGVNFGRTNGEFRNCNENGFEGKSEDNEYDYTSVACVQWTGNEAQSNSDSSSIRIERKTKKDGSTKHATYKVGISNGGETNEISVCFNHEGQVLYGGPVGNVYPAQKFVKTDAAYVTEEASRDVKDTGSVIERKWLTSGGRGVWVKPGSPLFFSQNETELCFRVTNESPYSESAVVQLEFDLCSTQNVKEAWLCQNSGLVKTPLPSTDEYIVREPIWSTWVAYKTKISQSIVMDFANTIKKYNFRLGTLEIDDKWETCYGSQIFDLTTFPDAKTMIEDLHALGAKVSIWMHPFINTDCDAINEQSEHLFKNPDGSVGITTWWNGEAALINFLQQDTYDFFVNRLQEFKLNYNVDGFKFDAGETSYIPGLLANLPLADPNSYSTAYVKMAETCGPTTEVRVGAETSNYNLFQRLQDTNTDWTMDNYGLKSVITSTLQLSTLGYRAIMPDMVGGNLYNQDIDKELYIRWVELTAFLPVMQFSYHPWNFDQETIDLTKRYIDLHYQYSDQMLKIYNDPEAPPLINPVWWLDPERPEALQITDEFLVGDEILVAPVVEQGATSRNVYIPTGTWIDGNNQEPIVGPMTIQNYPAPLQKLPYFIRQV